MIISVVNGKGGVGKSTVAINLAGSLSHYKAKVLLIDADPQETIIGWFNARENQTKKIDSNNLRVAPQSWNIARLENKLETESQLNDFTIIDCGPANGKIERSALALSDYAIIPVTPSPYDIRSAKTTIDLIREGKNEAGLHVKVFLLISRKMVGTNLGDDVREALKIFNLPILKTEICQRVALCEAGIVGQTIYEYAQESIAAKEFDNLAKEVLKWQKRN